MIVLVYKSLPDWLFSLLICIFFLIFLTVWILATVSLQLGETQTFGFQISPCPVIFSCWVKSKPLHFVSCRSLDFVAGQGTFCSSSGSFCCALCVYTFRPHAVRSKRQSGVGFPENKALDGAAASWACGCQLDEDRGASLGALFLGYRLAASWLLNVLGIANFVCEKSRSLWNSLTVFSFFWGKQFWSCHSVTPATKRWTVAILCVDFICTEIRTPPCCLIIQVRGAQRSGSEVLLTVVCMLWAYFLLTTSLAC